MIIDKGNYKLYKGDCLEIMDKLIELRVKFDAIITDLPYGTTQAKWDSIIPLPEMWEKVNELIKKDGAILFFSAQPFTTKLISSNMKNFKQEIIWDKQQGTGFANAKNMVLPSHENIILFSNGKTTYNPQMIKRDKVLSSKNWKQNKVNNANSYGDIGIGSQKEYAEKYPTSVFSYGRSMRECNNTKRVHTNQKPLFLMDWLIKTYTNEGDLILDFTMGSGSTIVSAIQNNRLAIGIELDDNYFDIAYRRLEGTNK